MKRVLVFAGVLFTAALNTGCAAFKHVIKDFGQCQGPKLPAEVEAILPQVEAALAGDPANISAAFTSLAEKVGVDVLECAVVAIVSQLQQASHQSVQQGIAVERAHAFIAGYRLSHK